MTLDDLREIDSPDTLTNGHLKALWHQQNGDWDTAHGIVQRMADPFAEWIHALLHREEGDLGNAKYWYSRCGRPYPGWVPFEKEVSAILLELPE